MAKNNERQISEVVVQRAGKKAKSGRLMEVVFTDGTREKFGSSMLYTKHVPTSYPLTVKASGILLKRFKSWIPNIAGGDFAAILAEYKNAYLVKDATKEAKANALGGIRALMLVAVRGNNMAGELSAVLDAIVATDKTLASEFMTLFDARDAKLGEYVAEDGETTSTASAASAAIF